ncbi:hypothetical protein B0G76_1119 [Paraburkholderia sp. BL23I1N1]|uniref:hypothetical protein n=1 Tax=Paraburkholderia sp. BL23I1N1 TaxID=1938802 RepID=UPI000FF4AF7E|nr:hypothetical protein [Paraburkholderia sp. BL23I1N1]RKE35071.1 hypothetical protein B0G76_1119 [Paraburkholderia sp. BL23I1N1]
MDVGTTVKLRATTAESMQPCIGVPEQQLNSIAASGITASSNTSMPPRGHA